MSRNFTKTIQTVSALVGGTLLVGGFASLYVATNAANAATPKTEKKVTKMKAGRTPVLVELFTSEGCSSCPPADALLAKLLHDQPVEGTEIIALSEHVDYWNSRSWNDPFSSAKFSDRQAAYQKSLHLDTVYTPQMVVDGHAEFVGSDRETATSAISDAANHAKAEVHLRGEIAADTFALKVKVAPVTGLSAGDKAEVMLAITEENLHSQVAGGENSGRKLNHVAVVRELKTLGTVTKTGLETTLTVPLKTRWKRTDLGAVVFVQAQNSRRILGAATLETK